MRSVGRAARSTRWCAGLTAPTHRKHAGAWRCWRWQCCWWAAVRHNGQRRDRRRAWPCAWRRSACAPSTRSRRSSCVHCSACIDRRLRRTARTNTTPRRLPRTEPLRRSD